MDEVAIGIKNDQSINPLSFLEPFSTVKHVGLTIHVSAEMGYDTMCFESYRYPINCEKYNIQLPSLFKEVEQLFTLLIIHGYNKLYTINNSTVKEINTINSRGRESYYFNKVNDLKKSLDINQKKEIEVATKSNSWFRFSLESTLSEISPITFTSSNVPQKINNISRYEPELHRFKPYDSETFSLYND